MATAYDMSRFDDIRDPRYATRVPGALLTYRQRDEILVENVSRSGALVRGDSVPEKGTEVVLTAGELQVVATVAWVSERVAGLNFHRAIGASLLRQLRPA